MMELNNETVLNLQNTHLSPEQRQLNEQVKGATHISGEMLEQFLNNYQELL